MIKQLRAFFNSLAAEQQGEQLQDSDIKMAAAVLLVEVMMADHHIDEAERLKLIESLTGFLSISRAEAMGLIDLAEEKHKELVSLHEMTRIINLHFELKQKIALIEYMWQIAFADSQWDKYEEHLIRKVSELLYVSHKDFVRARHKVQHGE
jgi:uncharacterized tellurite resistance protein B-like protein